MIICIEKFEGEFHAQCKRFYLSCPATEPENFAKNVALRVDVSEVVLWFEDDNLIKVGRESIATTIYSQYCN